jgi:hypothetical protein
MIVRAGLIGMALLWVPLNDAGALEQDVPRKSRFVGELQRAVRANDKLWLANHMRYPVRYHGGQNRLIRNKSRFVRQYSSIFSSKLRASVLAQDPNKLFENWQGIMIGEGSYNIWIKGSGPASGERYEIITINDAK